MQRILVRILVIDDDELSREILLMLLDADGYTAEGAASGDDALLHNNSPDIILTDMQMPGLCGNALALRLRELHGPETRLIAMSGSEVSPGERAHYDGFLLKPFAVDDLESLLANETRSAEPDSAEVLDEATYTKLLSAMSPNQVAEMFAFCLTDADKRIDSMRQALANADDTAYRREAHTIKGGCGMLGALELKQIAGTMEAKGIAGDGSQLNNPREQFVAASVRLRRILNTRSS